MLKIDLLPRHFAVARTNRIVLAGMVALLVLVMLGWGAVIMNVKAQTAEANRKYEEVKPIADKVRATEAETQSKQAQLQPIADKVKFVELADKSGEQYWDRFHAINKYIYEKAQVRSLSITNPDSFNMQVVVGDTTECARFVLNLIRCPALTAISISGLPAGVSIEGAGAGAVSFTPAAEAAAAPAGAPGAPEAAGPAPPSAAGGEIVLSVSAKLVEPVSEPLPPGAGGGGPGPAGGMAPGEGGAPGAPGGGGPPGGGGGGEEAPE